MSTEMVLAEVMRGESIVMFGTLGLVVILGLWCWYLCERWSWIPRKRHNRVFNEKF